MLTQASNDVMLSMAGIEMLAISGETKTNGLTPICAAIVNLSIIARKNRICNSLYYYVLYHWH